MAQFDCLRTHRIADSAPLACTPWRRMILAMMLRR
jgi:hypothetical protein